MARLLLKWQKRLRLLDWDLTLDYRQIASPVRDTPIGSANMDPEHKSAVITIIDTSNWPFEPQPPIEETIIHELLHLHMVTFESRKLAHEVNLEQAINCIAQALYYEIQRPRPVGKS